MRFRLCGPLARMKLSGITCCAMTDWKAHVTSQQPCSQWFMPCFPNPTLHRSRRSLPIRGGVAMRFGHPSFPRAWACESDYARSGTNYRRMFHCRISGSDQTPVNSYHPSQRRALPQIRSMCTRLTFVLRTSTSMYLNPLSYTLKPLVRYGQVQPQALPRSTTRGRGKFTLPPSGLVYFDEIYRS